MCVDHNHIIHPHTTTYIRSHPAHPVFTIHNNESTATKNGFTILTDITKFRTAAYHKTLCLSLYRVSYIYLYMTMY